MRDNAFYDLPGLITIALLTLALQRAIVPVQADVTLYVPGFDEVPLSASVLGIDSGSNRTTYALLPGVQTGVVPAPTFTNPATLIEGPLDVRFLSGNNEISCTITSEFAFCIGERGYPVTPQALGTAARFVVQGGDVPSTSAAPATTQVMSITSAAPASAVTTTAPAATSALPTLGGAVAGSVTPPPTSATAVTALATATALRSLINSAAPSAADKPIVSLSAICMSLLGVWAVMLL
ncbi:unnamed protein product [Peniophora sp. CBMAI 1063]|nr:unnamed protein product [Peniophora sp. CBMAI 1063]